MSGAAPTARLFGKLPAHGDFVCRGFVSAERETLDRWLSDAVETARTAHGESFESRYDTAPPWRYAIDDGHGGGAGGAMALSQDAVGRRFPIFLEVSAPSATAPATIAGAVEALLYDAIVERWDADALVAAAAEIECHAAGERAPAPGRWWLADGGHDAVATGSYPPELIARMLATGIAA